jgi:hypothetical protein
MNQLDQLLSSNIQDIQDHYINIENRLQHIEQSNLYLQEETNTIMSTLPQLTDKVTSHQAQLLYTLNDNSEFCKLITNVIKEVQRNQTTSDD